MTYEEWREINIPDWRNYPSNGWNDPNEGWYYEYTKRIVYPQKSESMTEELKYINRLEVIDQTGRVLVKYLTAIEKLTFSIQDNGRTLKVFIENKE